MGIGRQILRASFAANWLVDLWRHKRFRAIPIVHPEFDQVYSLGCLLPHKLARLVGGGSLVNYVGREWRPTIPLGVVIRDNSVASGKKQGQRGVVQLSRALVVSNLKFDIVTFRA